MEAAAAASPDRSHDEVMERLCRLGGTDHDDLVLLGKIPEDHVVEKVALAGVAAVVAGVGYVVISAYVGEVSLRQAVSVAALAGVLGFMAPVCVNRAAAARLRRDLRAMWSGYLDVIVVGMVGRPADERLFVEAAEFVDGPGVQLRMALGAADVPPVEALGNLAAAWGLHDIETVMTRVRRPGTEAREVQETLEAKAASLRHEILATIEVPSRRQLDGEILAVGVALSAFHLFLLIPLARAVGWV